MSYSGFSLKALSGALVVLFLAPLGFAELSITGVGQCSISGVPSGQEGLSGITWAGGTQYYAVEDSGGRLHSLTVNINSSSGVVTSAVDNSQAVLNGRADLEGVAYSGSGTVYVSDETGAKIKKYNLSGGNELSSVSVPGVYSSYRTNYSLESLTLRAGSLEMWTSNEEALYNSTNGVDDGSLSTTSIGTVVRLQKFTRDTVNDSFVASGQWAYQTDTLRGTGFGNARSGVSDLCILPNGKLLVLEREYAGWLDFRNRIYEVDFTGATDTSGINSLNGASYNLVSKSNLWENIVSSTNFEGLCLGPELDNGDYSMLMISDGDSGLNKRVYSLKLTIPEPSSIAVFLVALGFIRRRK